MTWNDRYWAYLQYTGLPATSPGAVFDDVTLKLLMHPFPEYPKLTVSRSGKAVRMVPGFAEGVMVPGRTVAMDGGAHESGQTMEVVVPYLDNATADLLRLAYAAGGLQRFSPDYDSLGSPAGPGNEWLVYWDFGDNALSIEPFKGFPGKSKATLKFRISSKIV